MTADLLIWAALAAATVLGVLTLQLICHNPATCRTCVERAARRIARGDA
jgi:hypothetical protein